MCIGFPMTVVDGNDIWATCERRGETHQIGMMLVGEQPAGTKVLVHMQQAMRVLDDDEAQLIDNALDGLAAALEGREFEHLFADLVEREPELPEHLN